ncbi:helix-turn-helix domain-containing protein [Shewanella sp. D64]|uniref:helix-turn-helix domain-containing protein n=1 Tax=unclassified Shewanella TaxID=196818 RepID=UPI0022BA1B02|nr:MULTISPECIES: helix-turn-helix domain-containing protein [unclassified Shewanella]MEC4728216.1 helix-turn-helix domain-containing protein [Shewanella sp. D64]MEC4740013.1 helix-turn-helix domain-containing protein [Shewanella sp. E94]WBJ94369.1 helix-turn-helix domain-containing protein [Shewanella sp. MTB7]
MNNKTLSNLANETSWKMSAAEYSVIETMVLHRGQVLSREELLLAMPEEQRSYALLTEAIERIRFYLGVEYTGLIETVDKQGYVLHSTQKSKVKNISSTPFGSISAKHYAIFIGLLLGLLWIINSVFVPAVQINPVQEQMLTSQSSKVSFYPIFTNIKLKNEYRSQIKFLAKNIEMCAKVPWQHIFVSVSHDDNLISIVLKRENLGSSEIKNLKQVPVDDDWYFIDQSWLIKVGICG